MAVIPSTLVRGYTYQLLDGANISDELVTVAALASGDNTVNLPFDITNLPIAIIPVTIPDGVTMVVKSFSQVTMTPGTPLVWDVATPYTAGQYVTYNGVLYVALDSTTGNIPSSSGTKWQKGNVVMTQVVLTAGNTASSGCTLLVRVGTD